MWTWTWPQSQVSYRGILWYGRHSLDLLVIQSLILHDTLPIVDWQGCLRAAGGINRSTQTCSRTTIATLSFLRVKCWLALVQWGNNILNYHWGAGILNLDPVLKRTKVWPWLNRLSRLYGPFEFRISTILWLYIPGGTIRPRYIRYLANDLRPFMTKR